MAASTASPDGTSGAPPRPGTSRPNARARVGLAALLGLGAALARRGALAVLSIAVSGLTAVVLAVVAVAFARRGGDAPVDSLPLLTSSAIAWGGGFLLAVSAAAGALRRDRVDGIRDLFVTRTTSLRGYVVARVGGLAAVLAATVGGGTLLVSGVAILAATRTATVLRTTHATMSAVVYALAFALVIAPVAFAALGARTRFSGYLVLLFLLVAPELVASALSGALPSEVTELVAIPSALAALRSSLAPGSVDLLRAIRALVALLVFAGLALALVRRDVVIVSTEVA
ncbi:MAG: hypothetical protein KF850_11430 [Labilithrix sp.]|nr:hypothetical protein [Labilithrix sp.]